MSLAIWAAILIIAALLLLLAELFLPSGGILGALASVCLVAGLVCLFMINYTLGLLGIVLTLAGLPILIAVGIKIFPKTPVGRKIMLQERQQADTITYDRHVSRSGSELIDQQGVAETDLRPVGTVRLNESGRRIECFAEGGVIDAGAPVKVTRIQGMEVKVRPLA